MILERILCVAKRFVLPAGVGFFAFFVLQRKFSHFCFPPPGETSENIINVLQYLEATELSLQTLIEINKADEGSVFLYDAGAKNRAFITGSEKKDDTASAHLLNWVSLDDDGVYALQLDIHKSNECWLVEDVAKLPMGLYRQTSIEQKITTVVSCPIVVRGNELAGYVKLSYQKKQTPLDIKSVRSSIQASTIVNID